MAAYYNEFDPKAAAWLRELIKRSLIADGDVDERSIVDVRGADLTGYDQCHFFAGIGGWSYALRLAGIGDREPVWTGSCPCQDFSAAGKQEGIGAHRDLWPEFRRLIAECAPHRVFGEQVANSIGFGWIDQVRTDVEAEGYAIGVAVLGAHSLGAPHIRQRLYWVAESHNAGSQRRWINAGEYPDKRATGPAGSVVRLGDAGCERDERRREPRVLASEGGNTQSKAHQREWCRDADSNHGATCGLAVADGRQPSNERIQRSGEQRLIAQDGRTGFWDAFDIVHCTDNKARPIEPGSFPLAHGIPARMGRLRGYGNAIVPQVAAAFVRAAMDVLNSNRIDAEGDSTDELPRGDDGVQEAR